MAQEKASGMVGWFVGGLIGMTRRFLLNVLSSGPIPQHIAFIMDGNRRFAKKWKLEQGAGHKAGFLALVSILKYCYEIGVKYVTVYAFSLDNFNRRPDEVQYVMDLMQEKIEGFMKELNMVNKYGIRVLFVGDLSQLYEPVRVAAEKAMEATANNTNTYLLVCVAYSSSHEISRAVYEACERKNGSNDEIKSDEDDDEEYEYDDDENEIESMIKVVDVEKNMYMGVVPDPDILVRSSGETRLSNFLLWQSSNSLLYSPKALWPEMGLRHVIWGILKYQKNYYYLEKKKKQV